MPFCSGRRHSWLDVSIRRRPKARRSRPNAATAYDLPLQPLSTPPERVPIATRNLERGGRSHRVQQGVLAHTSGSRTSASSSDAGRDSWYGGRPRRFNRRARSKSASLVAPAKRWISGGTGRILVDCSSSGDNDCLRGPRRNGEVRFPWRDPGARNVVVFATWYVPKPLSTPPDRGDEIKELSASWLFRAS